MKRISTILILNWNLGLIQMDLKNEKKKTENCTILIPKGNSYCGRKSSARGPLFKVSSEGLSVEIDIPLRSPIQVQTKANVA